MDMLKKGDKGEEVRKLQQLLEIEADGDFGVITRRAVCAFQLEKGLVSDGLVGVNTWAALIKTEDNDDNDNSIKPSGNHTKLLSAPAMKLIIDFEVGGGEVYYNRYLDNPCWPGYASGITIGIGYDLGYKTKTEFKKDWAKFIDNDTNSFKKLNDTAIGVKGKKARPLVKHLKYIDIKWEDALSVFEKVTIPKWLNKLERAFPGANKLHKDVQGALVSLIFNRGTSMTGSRRRHMRYIRDAVKVGDLVKIEKSLRDMSTIWQGTDVYRGLKRRRDAEANLVKKHTKNK